MKLWMRTLVPLAFVATALVGSTGANATSARLGFHVADTFLSQLTGVPQTGAKAETSDGAHVLRFSGSGSFAPSGTATGGGVWAHSSGETDDLFAFGTWTATGAQSFESFGCGGIGSDANVCGGVLELSVHLSGVHLVIGPEEVDGVLTIVRAVGPNVPPGVRDGATFTPVGISIDFDTSVADPAGATFLVARSSS